ncbi:hypothetical protein F4778DRAFT_793037 [Xylariomycetidae sp. FL2044]|nr:hypothetical protein F4778DRAFT_793037 [Xylariomycetidae sp. FL2044]
MPPNSDSRFGGAGEDHDADPSSKQLLQSLLQATRELGEIAAAQAPALTPRHLQAHISVMELSRELQFRESSKHIKKLKNTLELKRKGDPNIPMLKEGDDVEVGILKKEENPGIPFLDQDDDSEPGALKKREDSDSPMPKKEGGVAKIQRQQRRETPAGPSALTQGLLGIGQAQMEPETAAASNREVYETEDWLKLGLETKSDTLSPAQRKRKSSSKLYAGLSLEKEVDKENPIVTLPAFMAGKYCPRRPKEVPVRPPNEDRLTQIFASEEEREEAIDAHNAQTRRRGFFPFPRVLQYGVRYMPPHDGRSMAEMFTSGNDSRLIMVSGLADGTLIRDVLARIRGGDVVRATLVRSTAVQFTALVWMSSCPRAHDYVKDIEDRAGEIFEQGVVVQLAPTPTFPLEPELNSAMDDGCTRCIGIQNFPTDLTGQLLEKLSFWFANDVKGKFEDIWIGTNGTLYLAFTNLEQAIYAYNQIPSAFGFPQLTLSLGFAQDHCNDTITTLKAPYPLYRGANASILDDWSGLRMSKAPAKTAGMSKAPAKTVESDENSLIDLVSDEEEAPALLNTGSRLAAKLREELRQKSKAIMERNPPITTSQLRKVPTSDWQISIPDSNGRHPLAPTPNVDEPRMPPYSVASSPSETMIDESTVSEDEARKAFMNHSR